MIKFIGFVTAVSISGSLWLASPGMAAEEVTPEVASEPLETTLKAEARNVKEGNVAVSGSFGIGYSTYDNGSTTSSSSVIYFNPTAEYFIIDQLSVGGSVATSFSTDYTHVGFGPSATYHFYSGDRWTKSVGAAIQYSMSKYSYASRDERTATWSGQIHAGMNYFITPSVAFGPHATVSVASRDRPDSNSNLDLRFRLAVFL